VLFLGLTPRSNLSGGKERPGRASKIGNRYLRTLFVVGARGILYHRTPDDDGLRSWAIEFIQAEPFKVVAVALADHPARTSLAIIYLEKI
jgi:transposase